MALQFTYCKIWKWIDIDWSEFYNFYGKDFNPNVPSPPTWTTTWVYNETSNFNLVWFQPWNEVWCCVVIMKNNWDSSRTQHLYADFYQWSSKTWTYDAGNVTVGAWGEWMLYAYFWVDYDEIWSWYSNYRVEWQMLDDSIDASFSVSNLSIDGSTHSSWYLWIEWENLCYTDATYSYNQWYKHKIQHDSYTWWTWSPWYIRLPTSSTDHRIYYTDAYWTVRRTHVASDRYSPTWTPNTWYVWTQYAWKMRVPTWDMEDGYWYLCYVDSGWYKRRMGNWEP